MWYNLIEEPLISQGRLTLNRRPNCYNPATSGHCKAAWLQTGGL